MRKLPPQEVGKEREQVSFLHSQSSINESMMLASPTQLYVPLPQHPLYSNLWAAPQGESPYYEYGVTAYDAAQVVESPGLESGGSSYVEVVVERRDDGEDDADGDGDSGLGSNHHKPHSMKVEQHSFDLRSSAGGIHS